MRKTNGKKELQQNNCFMYTGAQFAQMKTIIADSALQINQSNTLKNFATESLTAMKKANQAAKGAL